ncbi:CinA family protein [Euzebya sp.]|uniref:CinA family protein n=1 Tax=Euzebya sp. TaxID=1971409 RepID=UPI003518B453
MSAPARRPSSLPGSDPQRDAETLAGVVDLSLERRIRRVLQHLSARDLKLATAESCTGGLLASLFTDVEGVSHVFDRGLVTYDPMAKCELLGIDPEVIERHTAVSREVAVAMAEGLLDDANAQVGIAVTGFTGSGREPGLVHLAVARTGRPTVHRELHLGTVGRGAVRQGVLRGALQLLEETL